MAKIVFSDGSKALAHNLDDLRERWLLRRQEEARVTGVLFPPINEPDYMSPSSWEQAEEWYGEAVKQVKKIEGQLSLHKANKNGSRVQWQAHRDTLSAELSYRVLLQAHLKPIVKQFRVTNSMDDRKNNDPYEKVSKAYRIKDKALKRANRRIFELEVLVASCGLPIPPYINDSED